MPPHLRTCPATNAASTLEALTNGTAAPVTGASGVVTEFGIPTFFSQPAGITLGPDGNLWFSELNGGRIARITTGGVVTEFDAGISAGAGTAGMTVGADGNFWFAEQYIGRIGRAPTGVPTAQRTFVSAHGQDSNPCTLASPCRM